MPASIRVTIPRHSRHGAKAAMHYLWAYPFATASSVACYAVLIALAIPRSRRAIAPSLGHPVRPHQEYLDAFDTIRGLAAAWVALGHCWWASYPLFASTQQIFPWIAYNTKAVPIFAVLSGFLIYRSVLSSNRFRACAAM